MRLSYAIDVGGSPPGPRWVCDVIKATIRFKSPKRASWAEVA
jgi:hypothetical protein